MPNYFFSADHHFDHANIIRFVNRPFGSVEEMNEELIMRHNSIVGKGDIVVIAGDFSFAGRTETHKRFINRLNGDLIFLRGDHDYWMGKKALVRQIWHKTIDKQYVTVCHYPMRTWPKSHYNSWQLHGHSHGKLPPAGKQLDIGVDTNDFYPYAWEEIKAIMEERPDNFNLVRRA